MTVRMFATAAAAAQYDNPNGMVQVPSPPAPAQRAYTSTMGTPIDVPGDMSGDAAALANMGYVVLGAGSWYWPSGATAARPAGQKPGTLFYDTTLNATIFWDGATWRNPNTFAAV